jgi:hypothetical protein
VVSQPHGLIALAVCIAIAALYGAAVWAAGASIAVRRVRGREPELIVALAARQ